MKVLIEKQRKRELKSQPTIVKFKVVMGVNVVHVNLVLSAQF